MNPLASKLQEIEEVKKVTFDIQTILTVIARRKYSCGALDLSLLI